MRLWSQWHGVTIGRQWPRPPALDLQNNALSGEIPAELVSFTNLEHLRLNDNQLTGEIPASLGRLENLTLLHLSGNQLTGCVPAALMDVEDNDFAQLGLAFCIPCHRRQVLLRNRRCAGQAGDGDHHSRRLR